VVSVMFDILCRNTKYLFSKYVQNKDCHLTATTRRK
jgi:hypothetical protein